MSEPFWDGHPAHALFAPNEEDRFTGYLAELLLSDLFLRTFLERFVQAGLPADDLPQVQVHTQLRIAGGRPDLVIEAPNTLLIFEAKVAAWLHGNQIKQYARHLQTWQRNHPQGLARLFLLAPRSQLRALLRDARAQLQDTPIHGLDWQAVAQHCRETAQHVNLARLRVHLEDFAELVDYRLGHLARPFTEEEVQLLSDRLTAEALGRAFAVVTRVVSRLQDRFGDDLTAHKNNGAFWAGYRLKHRDRTYWFGIWVFTWAHVGLSPIALQIYEPIPHDIEWPDPLPEPVRSRQWRGAMLPLPLTPQVPIDNLADVIADQVARCFHVLAPTP